ncbi:MAG: hypothetical protein C0417_11820 [Chlorobiaceae bacterium]|nr:hypothetical protein [Chlorobiaceae bacterium]
MDDLRKTAPITVRNMDNSEVEVHIKIIFGYVTTDDTGKSIIVMDSISVDSNSSARWIRPYPVRFVLGGGESQTVRLVATPSPGLADGEYWCRVLITSYPRGITTSSKKTSTKGAMTFAYEIGLPIYFRHGKISTGLDQHDFSLKKIDNELEVHLDLERTGNASFNGSQMIRIRNKEGEVVRTVESENLVVFNKYKLKEKVKVSDLPAGMYNIELEILSKRKDISAKYLLSSPPLRLSGKIELP